MRGAVDLYTRFVSWQAVRLACLQSGTHAPRFREYFDPSTDIVAPAVHTLMGAGAAVLFGTTGQISGAYAALVVGMSAPMLLTQLTRVQTVNEVVTGDRPAAETTQAAAGSGTTAPAGPVAAAESADVAAVVEPPPSSTEPRLASPADPARPSASSHSPLPTARSSARPPAAVARSQDSGPGEHSADEAGLQERTHPAGTSFAADPPDGAGSGIDGRTERRWRHGPAMGEEGL